MKHWHNDEILDVSFNTTGTKLVTASADGNARVYNTMTGACHAILAGHEGEISKVLHNILHISRGFLVFLQADDQRRGWILYH
jgi:WD40 repeat protein